MSRPSIPATIGATSPTVQNVVTRPSVQWQSRPMPLRSSYPLGRPMHFRLHAVCTSTTGRPAWQSGQSISLPNIS